MKLVDSIMSSISAKVKVNSEEAQARSEEAKAAVDLQRKAANHGLEGVLMGEFGTTAKLHAKAKAAAEEKEVLDAISELRETGKDIVESMAEGGLLPSALKAQRQALAEDREIYLQSLRELGLL
jgi:predicted Fe-Mo cluster-binding NifX family protein